MDPRAWNESIRAFYDALSPLYAERWGPHIHHGYFRTGREPKEAATEALVRLLAERTGLGPGTRVLDAGCGIGGSALWLSRNLGCEVTGFTLSAVQARMAQAAAEGLSPRPRFLVMDAQRMGLREVFDAVWAVEVLAHLRDHAGFFGACRGLLKPGGRLGIAAWLRPAGLSERKERIHIRPIEAGMRCALSTRERYLRLLAEAGLRPIHFEDATPQVQQTWSVGLEIIRDPALWRWAAARGKGFLAHLAAFWRMRRAFEAGAFAYGILIAERP